MKRFNYFISPAERVFGAALPGLISPALRAPLIALAAALVAGGAGYGVEAARLRAAAAAAELLAVQLAASEVAVSRVRRTGDEVERLRALAHRIEAIRASGDARADEFVALGNGIPSGTWLTSVRLEPRGLGIEGRSTRLDLVATTIAALGRLPGYRGAHLLHAQADTPRAGVRYAIGIESAP